MPFYPFLPDLGSGFVLLVVLAFSVLWVVQFISLMSRADDEFPGQFVRLGWIAAFVLMWAIAPIAFLLWSRGTRGRRSTLSRLHRGQRDAAD